MLVGVAGVVAVRAIVVEAAGVARAQWERKRSARLVGRSWGSIVNVQDCVLMGVVVWEDEDIKSKAP